MSGGELAFDAGIVWLIGALFFVLALLYSSVGHAGASGYLAVMALFEIPQELMRPVALSLNILVASITVFRFYKAGYLKGKDIWPLVIASVPSAFIGGSLTLPMDVYRPRSSSPFSFTRIRSRSISLHKGMTLARLRSLASRC